MNEQLLTKLKDELPSLLNKYCYNPNDNDYICFCCFCNRRAAHNTELVVHKEDCLGVELQNALNS